MANDIIPTENTTELQTPLRGILRNTNEFIIDHQIIKQRLLLVCLLVAGIVVISFILVFGLYS